MYFLCPEARTGTAHRRPGLPSGTLFCVRFFTPRTFSQRLALNGGSGESNNLITKIKYV